MKIRMEWNPIILTLLALAVVYGLGSTFFTLEVERLIERHLTPHIQSSPGVAEFNHMIYADVDSWIAAKEFRWIGYTCVVLLLLLALVGLAADRKKLAALGSLGFILPIYAYFILHMSFLAGLGALTALWTPLWGRWVRLGDIAYLPYMLLTYPPSLLGADIRRPLVGLISTMGLLVFILGILAWFYARYHKKGTADFWIYRFTRHPQYLGWIVWSYGLMLRVGLRQDTALGLPNLGASLPWALSTLVIVCVALGEEIHMRRADPQGYGSYRGRASFLLPLPRFLRNWLAAPLRWTLKKDWPESRNDLVWTFLIYGFVILALSLPFAMLGWPDARGWMYWPFP